MKTNLKFRTDFASSATAICGHNFH